MQIHFSQVACKGESLDKLESLFSELTHSHTGDPVSVIQHPHNLPSPLLSSLHHSDQQSSSTSSIKFLLTRDEAAAVGGFLRPGFLIQLVFFL